MSKGVTVYLNEELTEAEATQLKAQIEAELQEATILVQGAAIDLEPEDIRITWGMLPGARLVLPGTSNGWSDLACQAVRNGCLKKGYDIPIEVIRYVQYIPPTGTEE